MKKIIESVIDALVHITLEAILAITPIQDSPVTKISVQAPPNVTVIVLVTPQAQTN